MESVDLDIELNLTEKLPPFNDTKELSEIRKNNRLGNNLWI